MSQPPACSVLLRGRSPLCALFLTLDVTIYGPLGGPSAFRRTVLFIPRRAEGRRTFGAPGKEHQQVVPPLLSPVGSHLKRLTPSLRLGLLGQDVPFMVVVSDGSPASTQP